MFRLLLTLSLVFMLSACSTVWKGAGDTLKAYLESRQEPVSVSRQEVMETPYFQLQAETPDSFAVLFLTRANDGVEYWQSGSQESLVIRQGLVVRTTGLPINLEQTAFPEGNPFSDGLLNLSPGKRWVRTIDLAQYRYGIKAYSTFSKGPAETLTILEEKMALTRIDETLSIDDIGLYTTNHYWVDESGFIWKSHQTLWPGFTLTLTQLRPYR